MTHDESAGLLSLCALNWQREVDPELVNLWTAALADVSEAEGRVAVLELIQEAHFFPVVADVRARVRSLRRRVKAENRAALEAREEARYEAAVAAITPEQQAEQARRIRDLTRNGLRLIEGGTP